MTLTPEEQLEQLKTRALAAKGTPAETTLNLLIASLEEKIKQSCQPPQQTAISQNSKESNTPIALYFQALGTIYGKVYPLPDTKKSFILKSGRYEFPLSVPFYLTKELYNLTGEPLNIRVYPYIEFDQKEENNYRTEFIVTWIKPPPKNVEAGLFTLRGIWQVLPEYPYPVISVYRNRRERKKEKCEPQHIPVVWKKPPVPPYQYDTNTTTLSRRYFCQVIAKFKPKSQTFEIKEVLEEPTEDIPIYITPKSEQDANQDNSTDQSQIKSSEPDIIPEKIEGKDVMAIAAKMEVSLKINEFPDQVRTVEKGWKQFELNCEGRIITVTVKPRMLKKLEEARDNYPMWVAAISGKMGGNTKKGFILEQASIQVYERKPKPSE